MARDTALSRAMVQVTSRAPRPSRYRRVSSTRAFPCPLPRWEGMVSTASRNQLPGCTSMARRALTQPFPASSARILWFSCRAKSAANAAYSASIRSRLGKCFSSASMDSA